MYIYRWVGLKKCINFQHITNHSNSLPSEVTCSVIAVVDKNLPRSNMNLFWETAISKYPNETNGDISNIVFLLPIQPEIIPPKGAKKIPVNCIEAANSDPSNEFKTTSISELLVVVWFRSVFCTWGRVLVGYANKPPLEIVEMHIVKVPKIFSEIKQIFTLEKHMKRHKTYLGPWFHFLLHINAGIFSDVGIFSRHF